MKVAMTMTFSFQIAGFAPDVYTVTLMVQLRELMRGSEWFFQLAFC